MNKTKYILTFFIIISAASVCFSQVRTITFADNSMLEVTNEEKSAEQSPTIKIEYKEFTADLDSIGKAVPPLTEKTLKKMAKNNKSLASEISKIDSAFEVVQENQKFYFAAFNTVNYDDFRSCTKENKCKVTFQAVLITVVDKGKTQNILIIKSMKKLNC